MNKIINKVTRNPLLIFKGLGYILLDSLARFLSDEFFLKCKWFLHTGRRLDLKDPKTFNEKLQWLKLYDRNPSYTQMVDKYEVKKVVEKIIGKEYIIPTIDVYEHVEDINFDKLPSQFVLKCTHDSGGIVICTDKEKLDIENAVKKLKKGLKSNFYNTNREWPYKNVKSRIIAEKYMTDGDGELRDYKFFCFDGEPKVMFIASDRFNKSVETKFDFFDMNFNHLPFRNGHPNSSQIITKPAGFEKMKQIASRLSKGIPQVRVDLYDIDGQIYFGEMTFFHWGGFVKFDPEEWDYKMGEFIHLPHK